ncbi:MAG: 6-phosphogluconolactonase [Saprospiraceae bacterium]|nr:6-phosphogluconolactonase [Saprospiraceae bacterium]MCB9321631.1 6-phosphogluconolactonase [Lewinellaceae bacterium]
MSLHIYPDEDTLIHAYAAYITRQTGEAIARSGRCNLVLVGGNSPKRVYQLLTKPPYRNAVSWEKVYFFFGDERYVPADHERNNAHMAWETLLKPLGIDHSKVFVMDTSLTPEETAHQYALQIGRHFQEQPVSFDLVLLGLGDNAHTASLFPGSTVINETTPTVSALYVPDEKEFRITLTAPLINQAHRVSFLAFGVAKALAVYQVIEGERDAMLYPAQIIQPLHHPADWFLDSPAAALL